MTAINSACNTHVTRIREGAKLYLKEVSINIDWQDEEYPGHPSPNNETFRACVGKVFQTLEQNAVWLIAGQFHCITHKAQIPP